MDEDRERTAPSADDEFDRLRRARFGELPARVAPEDMFGAVDADPGHDEPGQPPVRREWG
ncbi:hypothetical protein ACN27J_08240 [Solwaraspora sp. WMMB762]|uniref:hypothetical protein n=1 Tax=unclassified Solwaraspora TaxID=2627926 RepID=UPI00249A078D|nr:hypothetical protein [Solwaraspora sp. WMMD937]WFE20821.1 hypothetical protein O7621_23565 [Solwaraspora sp. WMMD937]